MECGVMFVGRGMCLLPFVMLNIFSKQQCVEFRQNASTE